MFLMGSVSLLSGMYWRSETRGLSALSTIKSVKQLSPTSRKRRKGNYIALLPLVLKRYSLNSENVTLPHWDINGSTQETQQKPYLAVLHQPFYRNRLMQLLFLYPKQLKFQQHILLLILTKISFLPS